MLAGLAVLLGLDLVLGKLPKLAGIVDAVEFVAGAAAGALVGLAVWPQADVPPRPLVAAAGAVIALAVRLARRRAVLRLNEPLQGAGHIAVAIGADLVAAIGSAVVLAPPL